MIRWYLCSFEVLVGGRRITRNPAILRYVTNNGLPKKCAWLEVLNNRCLVKADVDDPTHAAIIADPDFREIPNVTNLSVGQRNSLRTVLENNGYTTTEINNAGLSKDAILQLIASVRCEVGPNANRDGIEIKTARRAATQPFTHFDKVPG